MLKKVQPHQLRCGMHLEKLYGPWVKHPFWRKSFLLTNPKDIKKILDSGVEQILIDTSKGLDVENIPEKPDPQTPPPPSEPKPTETKSTLNKPTSLSAERARAKLICDQSREAVESMFQEARMGKAISAERARPLVDEISSSVMRNREALISIARLKTRDDYTYMHSVAVCALMVALAQELELDEEQTNEAGIGGLMHDLGKGLMPLDVLNKPGKLTDNEFRIMKTHPQKGYDLLLEAGTNSEATLDIILHHHEKVDGSGYPKGLSGEAISPLSRMSAICDVYDAITSDRPYKSGWDPAVSVKRMASWKGHFDEHMFKAFVKSIGIYPVGSLVRLESEKLGVVLEKGNGSLLTPRVRTFYSAKSKEQIPAKTVDLNSPRCQDRIISVEDPQKWGFRNLENLWLEK
ncbi:HD-GYP domain-containing protein [Motiliproteus sp. MSK22-1]|uniref:HD-GYP domain-containing protein n=1 Tax=Motiliproteus sp. MSK22-1 TaxID=1897630 RepID=UPI0009757BFA|nr:HD-GYP domain-containing protein [Motiliproteus sp. MSK22-1]OMH39802.1 phosphodiesterase [Motiliproteus sp. MSK22-1]